MKGACRHAWQLGKDTGHICRWCVILDDLKCIRQLGQNHLNVTIGSALDLFGGEMEYDKVIAFCNNKEI